MNVLMLNGSPHENGCTFTALSEIAATLETHGIESEIWQLGAGVVHDCCACGACRKSGCCIYNDDRLNEFVERAKTADGFVFGSPVYYAHPAGQVLSFLDRAFYSGGAAFQGKPGAAVVSARRAGTTASLDVLNKYFTISSMPIVSSTYWNMVHGFTPDDVRRDEEGLQTMRNIGHAMAQVLEAQEAARAQGVEPYKTERGAQTNFIR